MPVPLRFTLYAQGDLKHKELFNWSFWYPW